MVEKTWLMMKLLKDTIQAKGFQKRHPNWRKLRNSFIKKYPQCFHCGSTTKLEVHHIIPIRIDPSKELEESNLMVLCESKKFGINCHLFIGHLGHYGRFNSNAYWNAAEWSAKIKHAEALRKMIHVSNSN